MYAPEVVESSLRALHDHPGLAPIFAESLPGGRLTPIPVAECHERRADLDLLWDREKGEPTRALSQDEQAFVANETLLVKIDYAYAAERYIFINYEGQSLQPMYPLWESQRLMLQLLAERELEHVETGHPDGLLFNILKGRQLGASTLVQSLLAHRVLTHEQVRTLIASDVPQNSGSEGLFGMLELVVEHWPWWLKPREKFHTKNQHIMFTNGSRVVVESGKSMKGGLQDDGQTKGQIGRSKTYSCVHLSEIATWERPDQINTALLPAVPRTPRTLMGRESTAQGRNNYWHQEWNLAQAGEDPRFFNIFIPWYAEQSKYWLPTPAHWVPADFTLAFARRAAEYGPRYMRRAVSLTREQLYWYELHYHAALKMERLYAFLSEYPSEPEEAFQNSGRSIFSLDTLQRLAAQARPMVDLWTIRPRADLLTDKEMLRAEYQRSQVETLKAIADLAQRHAETLNVDPGPALPITQELPRVLEIEPAPEPLAP